MSHKTISHLKDRRGEATVEFAIVAVLLLFVTFGIIEGGRIFGSWLIITNEAREAARWGAVRVPQRATLADVQNVVGQQTQGLLDQTKLATTASLDVDDNGSQRILVHVNYNVELFAPPLWQGLMGLPNPVPLSAESNMRTEDGGVGGG